MQALLGLVQKMGINVPTAALANLPQADGSSLLTALLENSTPVDSRRNALRPRWDDLSLESTGIVFWLWS
jgi:hypothetical protein